MIYNKTTLLIIFSAIYMISLFTLYLYKERISNRENTIYYELIIVNIFGLLLQLLLEFMIKNTHLFPFIIVSYLIKLYLVHLMLFMSLLTRYLFAISFDKEFKVIDIILKVIFCIIMVVIIILPVNLYYDPNTLDAYSYGLACDFVYAVSFVVDVLLLILLVIKTKKLGMKKTVPLYLFIFFVTFCGYIQQQNPNMTLIGCAESLICFLMFFTIENPDVRMLEKLEISKTQAENANRAKSDFLSSMSHDIRTPLSTIIGLSEDIGTYEKELPKQVKEDNNDIISASQTLLDIVDNILDINSIERDKIEITNITYNPIKEIKTIAKRNTNKIGEKPIEFKLELAEDIPFELFGDKDHIKKIINTLLSNSVKYTEEGMIGLSVKCINKNDICNLIIVVQDTGSGINDEDIDRIFNKKDKNAVTDGTKLGLTFVKKLVDMMGGKINVQSNYGNGSMFIVNIPQRISKMVDDENINIEEALLNIENNIQDGRNKRILIVDDDVLNIKVARRALSAFHFEIDDVTSGKKCIDLIEQGKTYDLILMDIMMPKMSGEATLKKLKEKDGFNTPVIALTADALTGAKEKYKSVGFVDYIAKPFNRKQIKEKIDKILK